MTNIEAIIHIIHRLKDPDNIFRADMEKILTKMIQHLTASELTKIYHILKREGLVC